MFIENELVQEAKKLGCSEAVGLNFSLIEFSQEVRKYCAMNHCGQYNKNWACPPAVGSMEELKDRVLGFADGILVQTMHYLKSSFDYRGMQAGKEVHEKVMRNLLNTALERFPLEETLLLGAGHCDVCQECAWVDGEPCRFPEKAMASLEAYGIDVMKLTREHGIPYFYGKGTVAYVGLLLYR